MLEVLKQKYLSIYFQSKNNNPVGAKFSNGCYKKQFSILSDLQYLHMFLLAKESAISEKMVLTVLRARRIFCSALL
jgi:hypothetical protein